MLILAVPILVTLFPCLASADPGGQTGQNLTPVQKVAAACIPCKTKCERCPHVPGRSRFANVAECKRDCDAHGGNPMIPANCSIYGRGNC